MVLRELTVCVEETSRGRGLEWCGFLMTEDCNGFT